MVLTLLYFVAMQMSEESRMIGWFWRPEDPGRRVAGVLTWSQNDGAELELIGGFTEGAGLSSMFEGVTDLDAIHGEADRGNLVTLMSCTRGRWRADGGGTRTEVWAADWVCVGAHVASENQPVFSHATFFIDDLYYLAHDARFCPPRFEQIEGVSRPGEALEDGTQLLPYVLPVVGGTNAAAASGETDSTRYRVGTRATAPWVSPATEEMPELKLEIMTRRTRRGSVITLATEAWARIDTQSPCGAHELLRRAAPVMEYVALATYAGCAVSGIRAMTSLGQEVSLFVRLTHRSRPGEASHVRPVFDLAGVELSTFLEARSGLTEPAQAEFAWKMLTSQIGYSATMVEEDISQALAAAEGLHRWCLQKGPGVKLGTRLKSLHAEVDEDVRGELALDVELWSDWAVWARHHVAHGGAEEHRDVDDYRTLKDVADVTKLISYLVVLTKLGVRAEQQIKALRVHATLRALHSSCQRISTLPAL